MPTLRKVRFQAGKRLTVAHHDDTVAVLDEEFLAALGGLLRGQPGCDGHSRQHTQKTASHQHVGSPIGECERPPLNGKGISGH
jgi:hypothetical protein